MSIDKPSVEVDPIPIPPNKMQKPNAFKIDEVVITASNGKTFSVTDKWMTIEIYEDIFSSSIAGVIEIKDAVNLIRHAPIIGQEQIHISWMTPGVGGKKITKDFRIYNVSGKTLAKNGQFQIYTLCFASNPMFVNLTSKCNYALQDKTVTAMMEDIFERHFPNSDLSVNVNSTDKHTFIMPMKNPFGCINWLCRRGVNSSIEGDSSFVFYEDLDGFKVDTLLNLLNKQSQISYKYKMPNAREKSSFKNLMDDFTNLDGDSLYFQKTPNKLNEISRGMYSSALFLHDLTTKTYTANLFDYNEYFESAYTGAERYPTLADIDTTTKQYATNVLLKPKSSGSIGDVTLEKLNESPFKYNNDLYEEWTQNGKSIHEQIQTQEVVITIAGDSRRRVGQMVNLVFPSPEPHGTSKKLELDEYVSGNYMITSIRHSIGRMNYKMEMELSRSYFEKQLPSGGEI